MGRWTHEDRIHLVVLLFVLLIALGTRMAFINQPMRYDEACTLVRYASQPLPVALTNYTLPNNHLFHTILVRGMFLLFGDEPWALRMPALLASLLLIPATYLAGRRLYSAPAGLLAAALVACAFPFVFYATNARGYTILCLIFVVLLWLGAYLRQGTNLGAWLLFAVLIAVGFYTIPTMLYPFGMVVTWLLVSAVWPLGQTDRKLAVGQAKRLVGFSALGLLLVALAYVPVLAASGMQSVVGNRFVRPHTIRYLIDELPRVLAAIWAEWTMNVPPWLSLALAAGAVLSLVFHRKVVVIVGLPLFVIPVMLVQRVAPPGRVWMFLLPLYLIMASDGVVLVLDRSVRKIGGRATWIWPVVSLIVVAAISLNIVQTRSVYYYPDTGTFLQADAVAAWLQDSLRPGDRIIITDFPGRWPLEYYLRRRGQPGSYFRTAVEETQRVIVLVDEAASETCSGVLSEYEWPVDRFGAPEKLGGLDRWIVYGLDRVR